MSSERKPLSLGKEGFDDAILESSQPALVDFWADWCAPCHRVAPVVDRLADEFAERLTVAKVNIDEEPELAQAYGIRSIPALLVFRNGEVVDRIQGAVPYSTLSQSVERALAPA